MNERKGSHSLFLSISIVFYFLFPFFVAWLSLSLTSMYMAYYDIGINASANNGFLLWIVAPLLLIILFITATVSLYLARRFQRSTWFGIALGVGLVFVVGIGAFLIQAWTCFDYQTEKTQHISTFLNYYVEEMERRILNRS